MKPEDVPQELADLLRSLEDTNHSDREVLARILTHYEETRKPDVLVGTRYLQDLLSVNQQRVNHIVRTSDTFPAAAFGHAQFKVWRLKDVLAWKSKYRPYEEEEEL